MASTTLPILLRSFYVSHENLWQLFYTVALDYESCQLFFPFRLIIADGCGRFKTYGVHLVIEWKIELLLQSSRIHKNNCTSIPSQRHHGFTTYVLALPQRSSSKAPLQYYAINCVPSIGPNTPSTLVLERGMLPYPLAMSFLQLA